MYAVGDFNQMLGRGRYDFGGLFGRSCYGLMLYEHEFTVMDKAVEGNTAQ